jgi:hypothetical protein
MVEDVAAIGDALLIHLDLRAANDAANLTFSQWRTSSGEPSNSINLAPLFANPPRDCKLQAASPARGARENGIDMGAYPQSSAPASLAAPTNVRIVP